MENQYQYKDKELQCVDYGENPKCQGTFVFTARDQEFYEKNNYNSPKRCRPCRDIKKLKFENQEETP